MTTRMLIDAGHPEETRVVVTDGHELQEFDVESSVKSQIKSNIYLAKVVRVEPSLQAAFVEYGGNRHGFLSFSEIHTDYFQVPVSDREELAAEQARLVEEAGLDDINDEDEAADAPVEPVSEAEDDSDAESTHEAPPENAARSQPENTRRRGVRRRRHNDDRDEHPEVILHTAILKRGYRIQEVIRRNQIILVQVTKEERGNKGAALTTYLSIAGRYCVLMPNTPRGGGISRKISDAQQRRRLKEIAAGLEVPEGMGLIIRTAGQNRTRPEIRRDYNSLLKQWEELRDRTLKSTAPSLIREEANIIMRAIRDLYTKDVEEVLVEGDEGYRTAKTYMKFLMPSHAARVKPHKEPVSLFHHFEVEKELGAMHSPLVPLKSGGYLVINPTEALVVIDINSGRSTKERSIEDTALKTNIEAAREIARQLRLRDLAGLIVIDFIDMDDRRNESAVERRMKEAVKADRARIQVGRISTFGLMELSRQRLRPSLEEAISAPCTLCNGSGYMRSAESTALHVLRGIESEALRTKGSTLRVLAPVNIAFHLLNRKRLTLTGIESRYDVSVAIESDDRLMVPDYRIETDTPGSGTPLPLEDEARSVGEAGTGKRRIRSRRRIKETTDDDQETVQADRQEGEGDAAAESSDPGERKRRRRGRRGGRRRKGSEETAVAAAETVEAGPEETEAGPETVEAGPEETVEAGPEEEVKAEPKRRRRGGRARKGVAKATPSDAHEEASGDVPPFPPDEQPRIPDIEEIF